MNICKRAVEPGDGPENIGTTSEVDGLVYCCIVSDCFLSDSDVDAMWEILYFKV